jgi:2'-5' RNA ligase
MPPTAVPEGEVDRVVGTLERVACTHAPFTVRLSGTGSFRPVSPVVFVTVAEGGSGCARLEQALHAEIQDAPRRFPYHPHVTIAHDGDDAHLDRAVADQARFEASFEVTSFTLFVEDDGAWRALRDFELSG